MRILLVSHAFPPSIGGLETVSRILAQEFATLGHEVQVVTQTMAPPCTAQVLETNSSVVIWRRPSAARLLELVRWCEVCFHNNVSLPRAWPLLCVRRPWVVAHHVWIPRDGVAGPLKRFALRFASCISISDAIASDLSTPSVVVPNPYDNVVFRLLPQVERNRDLIFVGRLVSDKGAALLLSAIAHLRSAGMRPSVTIVGDGPEALALQAQAAAHEMLADVSFVGWQRGEDLARLLNAHRVLVVPSLWREPFGIVALEAIACGCVVVGSDDGGLGSAIGPCGELFPRGSSEALATTLGRLLSDPARLAELRRGADQHLHKHYPVRVAREYLEVLERAAGHRSTGAAVQGRTDAG